MDTLIEVPYPSESDDDSSSEDMLSEGEELVKQLNKEVEMDYDELDESPVNHSPTSPNQSPINQNHNQNQNELEEKEEKEEEEEEIPESHAVEYVKDGELATF